MKLELDSPRPSWLPDFRKPTDYNYEYFRLPKYWQSSPRLKVSPYGKMITLPATKIDIVHITKVLDFDPYESQEDLKDIEHITTAGNNIISEVDHPLHNLRNIDGNVAAVMMFNSTIKLFGHLPRATRNAKCQSLWNTLVQGDTPDRPPDLNSLSEWWWKEEATLATFANEIQQRTHDLCFVSTSGGLLGIGPRELKIDDELVILNGTDTVVALRPIDGGQQHSLIGPVFILQITLNYEQLKLLYRKGKLEDKIFNLV